MGWLHIIISKLLTSNKPGFKLSQCLMD